MRYSNTFSGRIRVAKVKARNAQTSEPSSRPITYQAEEFKTILMRAFGGER